MPRASRVSTSAARPSCTSAPPAGLLPRPVAPELCSRTLSPSKPGQVTLRQAATPKHPIPTERASRQPPPRCVAFTQQAAATPVCCSALAPNVPMCHVGPNASFCPTALAYKGGGGLNLSSGSSLAPFSSGKCRRLPCFPPFLVLPSPALTSRVPSVLSGPGGPRCRGAAAIALGVAPPSPEPLCAVITPCYRSFTVSRVARPPHPLQATRVAPNHALMLRSSEKAIADHPRRLAMSEPRGAPVNSASIVAAPLQCTDASTDLPGECVPPRGYSTCKPCRRQALGASAPAAPW
jgi:hypothetical protein